MRLRKKDYQALYMRFTEAEESEKREIFLGLGVDKEENMWYDNTCSEWNAYVCGLLAQLVEHIVHIDGVTGSSPVQTTTNTKYSRIFLLCLVFLFLERKDEGHELYRF